MSEKKYVKVNEDYEDASMAGNVYKVTGMSGDVVTIEDGWLGECYSLKKEEYTIVENVGQYR